MTPSPIERIDASIAAETTSLSKARRQISAAAVVTGAAIAVAATMAVARATRAGTPYLASCDQ